MARRGIRTGGFEVTFNFSRHGFSVPEAAERRARRLSPIVWTVAAIITAWLVLLAFEAPEDPSQTSRLQGSLPFLAVLIIAAIGFMAVDRYLRRRELQRSAGAELNQISELVSGIVVSKAKYEQRRGRREGSSSNSPRSDPDELRS
jgi:choline-glycine betaine transporter